MLEAVGAALKLEQVKALCALTRGFCRSFCVKPWRESRGPI